MNIVTKVAKMRLNYHAAFLFRVKNNFSNGKITNFKGGITL